MPNSISLLKDQRPRAHVTINNLIDGLNGDKDRRRNWQVCGPGEGNNRGKDWIAYEAGQFEFIEHHFPDEQLARSFVEAKMLMHRLEAAGLKVSRFDAERFIKVMQERTNAAGGS